MQIKFYWYRELKCTSSIFTRKFLIFLICIFSNSFSSDLYALATPNSASARQWSSWGNFLVISFSSSLVQLVKQPCLCITPYKFGIGESSYDGFHFWPFIEIVNVSDTVVIALISGNPHNWTPLCFIKCDNTGMLCNLQCNFSFRSP